MVAARKTITIRKERFYGHAPQDVWCAITDAHALAEWFEPNNHEPVVGHKFQFVCDPGVCGDSATECDVVEAEAPRKLVWSWVVVPRKPGCAPSEPMPSPGRSCPRVKGRSSSWSTPERRTSAGFSAT